MMVASGLRNQRHQAIVECYLCDNRRIRIQLRLAKLHTNGGKTAQSPVKAPDLQYDRAQPA